jgi:hypothetical protein
MATSFRKEGGTDHKKTLLYHCHHILPIPLCVLEYVKIQSDWSCDEPEKAFLSVDTA